MLQSVLSRLRESQTAELEGEGAAEAGFTLIELMVVLLIIAILLAIAIPTFLGVTSSANDRATQSNLTNGLTEAESQFQANGQSYSGISAALVSSAPEFTWTGSAGCSSTQTNCISVSPVDVATLGDQAGVILAAMSKTGTCWYVAQVGATPVTTWSPANTAGFVRATATGTAGWEYTSAGTVNSPITTAGTYYAKKNTTTANCNATYPESMTTGFNWGSSFSNAGTAG
jgi:type IV pilus assembly protein PilA